MYFKEKNSNVYDWDQGYLHISCKKQAICQTFTTNTNRKGLISKTQALPAHWTK